MEFCQPGFQLILTKDGSYTLKGPETQAMHNLKGAVSETLNIYGTALDKAAQMKLPLRLLSVGLGLGLVEMLTAAHALQRNLPETEPVQIFSYELHTSLEEAFLEWIFGKDKSGVYQHNARLLCDLYGGCEVKQMRQRLAFWYEKGFLRFVGPLKLESLDAPIEASLKPSQAFVEHHSQKKKNCVVETDKSLFHISAYDAYSQSVHPEAWEESFLSKYIDSMLASSCVFASFACLGRLKRCLLSKGFKGDIRSGFGGKRESLLWVRS